jgi:L-iditol 2-dehydrogenase
MLIIFQATRPGGKVILVGMGTPVYNLPVSAAALREVDICGVFRYVNAYPTAIDVILKNPSDGPAFKSLLTHHFNGLDTAEEALAMASRKQDDDGNPVIKVVITNNTGC